ncbi:4-galactosyl-N-acetylglucosaminide 3-alpha-L-fucosyltransferase 9-like [Neoarius graeffei]|uniref:4-galactosyl-N-acetylglucosaminide 3-alpha-L-fucosyltransferase 9-like n=1 Tax=Neoarius graeffei TaxID=443677 RepID=UPI00298C779C|nr:4-galactosyl-N-acetylglucosaminide 3-alpha-L-fucosyltransferase 9-like [Neoarius graeffei]XP_060771459.1 4-galactosyl-N-acetylglucosaminide 3-alpha-L-fucosyltransferase 9-like [Neoarius graeffei]
MKFEHPVGYQLIILVLFTLLCLEGLVYLLYMSSRSLHLGNNEMPKCNIVKKEEEDTVVLIWSWPFGHWHNLGTHKLCSKLFNIMGCRLTDDRGEYDKVHGVIFHHRDIYDNVFELLGMRRPPLQKWVWMNMESPRNSERQAEFDGLFNLTASYRRDSDIWVPYGRIIEASKEGKTFKIPLKDKLVCWIVNNWDVQFKRVQYFEELRKHIQIDIYGGAFERKLSQKEYFRILLSCKFYLSFENSIYKDYFTEKLFNPMKVGTVPVVLGPPRENYEEFLPADSFIHVDDFESPQELAEHLKFLDQKQEAYEEYFTWRQHLTAEVTYFPLEQACRICDHIKRHKGYSVFTNLNKWYWD